MAHNVKNTADLRNMLLDVITDVRNKRIEHHEAKAISSLASQILTSARLDLEVTKSNGSGKDHKVSATLLTYDDDIIRSPHDELTDEEYRKILLMKKEGKQLAAICDNMKGKDKKIIGIAFYGKKADED